MTDTVRCERDGHILTITLDRPKANAIDAATSRQLYAAFASYRDDERLRCAIITGAGNKIFSAGWDLRAAVSGETENADYGPGGFAGLTEMWDLDKPVIAAVNGVAIGGGVELALACDLIVATDTATFALPETHVGVAADAGGLQRLPRKIPLNIAAEMLLTGRKMDMAEAAHWGLVNRVVQASELMGSARGLAQIIADGAPLSVRAIKECLREMDGMTVREAFDAIRSHRFPVHARMLTSKDHLEGPKAFIEKRRPQWTGC